MLLPKYYNLTPEEALEFEEYCRQDPSLRIIKQRLDNEKLVEEHTSHWKPESTEKRFPVIRQRILAATPQPARKSNTVVRWIAGLAAAAALITAIVWVTPLFRPSGAAQETAVKEVARASTTDHPALLLAEGYHILLDSLPHRKIWSNQRIRVTRTDNG
ncbi:MAG TPA: hypothetical protein VHC48_18870, partial [Puia sp.]|nr:hypothetical protein [Puia sp.]